MQQLQQGAKAREFTDAAAMMRHYREIQARTWAPRTIQAPPRPRPADLVATPSAAQAPSAPEAETALEPSAPRPLRLAPGAFIGDLRKWGPQRKVALRIIAQVAACHGITVEEILGPSRKMAIITARQDAMVEVFLARPDLSFPMIGRIFHRDHSTVVHTVKRRGLLRARDGQRAAEVRPA